MHQVHKHTLDRYKWETRKCRNCGAEFEVKVTNKRTGGLARGSDRRYCNNACKQEAYRARKTPVGNET